MNNNKFSLLKIPTLIVISLFVFYVSVGIKILDPSYIDWITGGDDPAVHYFGWSFFRQTPLSWPISINKNYGLDISSTIVYTDSIPLVAIPLKIIERILPTNFQYQGIWYLICYILQAFFAYKIFGLITKNYLIIYLGVLLLLFMPPFMSTVGMDAALASHFLILAGFYLHYKYRKINSIYWVLLIIISAGIHFYILVMVLVVWIATLTDLLLIKKTISYKEYSIHLFVALGLLVFFSWIFGYFVESTNIGSFGFGLFRATLLSFIDGDKWSRFLPAIRTSTESYGIHRLSDGVEIFRGQAYLGLGMISLVLYSTILVLGGNNLIYRNVASNPFFYSALTFLLIFSISNNITFGSFNYRVDLPEGVIRIASTLRSSIRMIWPVIYFISISAIIILIKRCSKAKVIVILTFVFILQALDISIGWKEIQRRVAPRGPYDLSAVFKNSAWEFFPQKYSKILQVPLDVSYVQKYWIPFGNYGSKYSLATNSVYLARPNLQSIHAANEKYFNEIFSGEYDPKAIYVVASEYIVPVLEHLPNEHAFVEIDGFNVVLPNWNSCGEVCPQLSEVKTISASYDKKSAKSLPLYFGKNSDGASHLSQLGSLNTLGFGWSYPEDWGVWAGGSGAGLILSIKDRVKFQSLVLRVRPYTTKQNLTQRLYISVNGGPEQYAILDGKDEQSITVPLPKNTAVDYLYISIRMLDSVSPKSLGLGEDARKLSFGLISVTLK